MNKTTKRTEKELLALSIFDIKNELPDLPTHTLEYDSFGLPSFTTRYKGIIK